MINDVTTTKMMTAVIDEPRQVVLREVARPEPEPHEVVVRLEGCGVCASNLAVWQGAPWFKYPLEPGAPGHEGWGYVAAVGSDAASVREGDRVALLSYHAFAEYDKAPADQVVRLPSALQDTPFPGEPLGCAINIFERSDIRSGQVVAIVGIGFLGALLTQLASHAGAEVSAISRQPFALQTAQACGARHTILMDDHQRIIDEVMRLTNQKGCDVVIEATGKQWPLDLSAEITAERGRLVIAGYHQDGPRQVNMQLWNWRGLDVINAHERDPQVYVRGMREAVRAVADGDFDPRRLFTHTFTLDSLSTALIAAECRPQGFLKGLVML